MLIRKRIPFWFSRFQNGLLPPICLLCGDAGVTGRDLCAACAADLPRNTTACVRCAEPIATESQVLCATCQLQPRNFDRAFIPFRYQPPMDFLLLRLKFNGRLSHARLLGDLFATAFTERGNVNPLDYIIPVPLHPLRLQERGFNQALELARATAHRFQIPLLREGLRRIRHTPKQMGLDAKHRQTNLLDAFVATRSFAGKRVVLIDDVVTTGSTTAECSRVLRAAGAADIEMWAIAHTYQI